MKNCQLRIANCRLALLRFFAFALLSSALVAQAGTTNAVQTTNTPVVAATSNTNVNNGTDFPSFKIIAERNIFSANRSGRVASSGPTRKPTKIDVFTLVGTIDYSKGMFAIFDGSSSSFSRSLKVGDSLAGFKITDMDLDHVTLVNTNGADTVLHVGSQMRRVDEGEWAPGSGPVPQVAKAPAPKENTDAATTEANADSSDEPAPSAETNDVLKKLMQKRKAEVKNESE